MKEEVSQVFHEISQLPEIQGFGNSLGKMEKKTNFFLTLSQTTEKIGKTSNAVDCSSAFSQERKGLTKNEK